MAALVAGSEALRPRHVREALADFVPATIADQAFEKPWFALEEVGGLSGVKKKLADTIMLPMRFPALAKRAPVKLRQGMILVGPPGCGKTMLAHGIIKESGLRMVAVRGPELLSARWPTSAFFLRKLGCLQDLKRR